MTEVKRQCRMDRRQALKRLAVVSSVSFAGCSSVLGSGRSGTVLGKIEVINSSFVANRIRLTVERDDGTKTERDDETLIDREISLAAIDAENGARGTIIQPLWSKIRGQYTIRALHYDESGNRETSSWEYTFTQEDYNTYYGDGHEDPGCIGAVVKIGSLDDTENGAIGIGPTYMENPCGTPDSR